MTVPKSWTVFTVKKDKFLSNKYVKLFDTSLVKLILGV
jgi:hypothetical protein